MKRRGLLITSNKGFTLLEVIVSLIVISLFGAMLLGFFQTQIVGSTVPIDAMRDGFALDQIMERMTADYENIVNTDPNPLTTLDTNITTLSYGTYTAITQFIAFDGLNNEIAATCPTDCTILKVTITVSNQTITTIFTQ